MAVQEVIKMRKKIESSLQMLAHVKEKLAFIQVSLSVIVKSDHLTITQFCWGHVWYHDTLQKPRISPKTRNTIEQQEGPLNVKIVKLVKGTVYIILWSSVKKFCLLIKLHYCRSLTLSLGLFLIPAISDIMSVCFQNEGC